MASQDPLTALGSPVEWAITRARSRADWALLARISNPYQRLLVAALAGINVVALAPFALWHLVLGRMLLGLITLLATAILAGLAFWVRRSYYVPWFAVLIVVAVLCAALLSVLPRLGPMGLYWGYPMIILIYFLLGARQGHWVAVPALLGFVAIGSTLLPAGELVRLATTLAVTMGLSIVFAHYVDGQRERLEARAIEDPLTKVGNRRKFMEEVERAVHEHDRYGRITALLSIDTDHFKSINDRFGHQVGDEILIALAQTIAEQLRTTDRVFRVGGEEFAVLLAGTTETPAWQTAERLLASISSQYFAPAGAVTVSIGVARIAEHESASDWLGRADAALYAAKANGRAGYALATDAFAADAFATEAAS